MKSPARKHFERTAAAKAAGNAVSGKPQTGEQYELHSRALWEARQSLKGIKSRQAKIEKKSQLLPEFMPYVNGVLEAGKGAQDSVLMTMLVWCIDTGELEKALEIGEYAVKHQLDTPDEFDRDTVTILAEEIAESVRMKLEQEGADAEALANIMSRTLAIVEGHDMHDQVAAKLHKSAGYALRESGHLEDALEELNTALSLNDRAGVKQDIQQLEKQLKNSG